MQDIIKYQSITRFIDDHFLEDVLDGWRRGIRGDLVLEAGFPNPHHMIERAFGSLGSCINAVANRAALHRDDGVMSVFPGYRRRQAEDVSGLRTARDQFEAHGRQMVAFVDHEMPIIADDVVDLPFADKALDQGDVNLTFRFTPAAADHANRLAR
jgi:hypothetical protein